MALEVPYRSIPDMFLKRVAATPNGKAFASPNADDTGLIWLTWAQVGSRAKAIAAGLRELGVGLEDRVSVMAGTRLEWVLVDLGINLAGAATTAVYPTTEPEDAAYIITDSGSKILVAENPQQALKLAGADTSVTHVVLIDGAGRRQRAAAAADPGRARGRAARAALAQTPDLIEQIAETIGPDNIATLIYTSGTTGRPKGVELLHGGWTWEGVAQADLGLFESTDLQYLWLPLSHSFGKTLMCGIIHVGVPTYVDGRVDKLVDMLAVVQPTLMCGAPRIFEKVYNRTVTTALGAGGAKAKIFSWAVGVGKQKVALEQAGKPIGAALKAKYAVAEKLVFSKLQQRLGGRLRVLVSGSAPLSRDISEFFAAANLPIMEGYGLTETSAANFVNRMGKLKIGTVGTPLGDLECKHRHRRRGAAARQAGHAGLPQPAEGDRGGVHRGRLLPHRRHRRRSTTEGYLTITDRKKDLVKTSGGKYIAPSHIEGMFKAVCPYTSQAVVVGQARNFVTMLISLDEDAIKGWAAGGPLDGKPYAEIVASARDGEADRRLHRGAERQAQPLGDDQEVRRPAARPEHRGRRDHPVDEDQAPQRGDQLRRADRQDVRGLAGPALTGQHEARRVLRAPGLPRSDEPGAVAHQQPAGDLVGLAPGLDPVRPQHQIDVVATGLPRIPVGLRGVPLGDLPALRNRHRPLEHRVDHHHIPGTPRTEPRRTPLHDVARRPRRGLERDHHPLTDPGQRQRHQVRPIRRRRSHPDISLGRPQDRQRVRLTLLPAPYLIAHTRDPASPRPAAPARQML